MCTYLPVVGVVGGDGALVTVMDTVGLHIRGDHVASHVTEENKKEDEKVQ